MIIISKELYNEVKHYEDNRSFEIGNDICWWKDGKLIVDGIPTDYEVEEIHSEQ